jgi:hypothetical protein
VSPSLQILSRGMEGGSLAGTGEAEGIAAGGGFYRGGEGEGVAGGESKGELHDSPLVLAGVHGCRIYPKRLRRRQEGAREEGEEGGGKGKGAEGHHPDK